ncbi:MAG: S1 RNA-binding domain-containing protein [Chloroflexi bacterium]|nr:S1 RNA-binding domain-containing protein [Chloroflexota bacterium]
MDELESSQSRDAPPRSGSDDDQEMQTLLEETPAGFPAIRRGDVIEGTVVQVGRDELLVDIGTKAEAIVPAHESGVPPGELSAAARVGERIVAMVLERENREGHAILSLVRAQSERGWRRLQQLQETGESIEADVVDFNRGGLIVNVDGLRGFVPLSQIVDLRQPTAGEETIEARLEYMKGRRVSLKVIEVNRRRNRLILSERAAQQERRARDRDRLIEELAEGQTRKGRVTSIADFGAFVDVGGADGLVHLSELSWAPVGHPSHVVRVGDEVEVLVLGVDPERKKIALSLKRLGEEPWKHITQRYQVGQIVEARVTKLATFGAFAEVEPAIEGLIHISELSEERIQHPKSVVHEGELVPVKIIRIEPERRRLGLSLRQARAEAAEAEVAGLPMVYGGDDLPHGPGDWMSGARVIEAESSEESMGQPEIDNEEDEETGISWRGSLDDRPGGSSGGRGGA